MKKIIILLSLLNIISCHDNSFFYEIPCEGKYFNTNLSSNAKSYLDIYLEDVLDKKVVFKNTDNEELIFNISFDGYENIKTIWNFESSTYSDSCIYATGNSEYGRITLENDANFKIELYLGKELKNWGTNDFLNYDEETKDVYIFWEDTLKFVNLLEIIFHEKDLGGATQFLMLVDTIGDINYISSLDIIGQTFSNVFYEDSITFENEAFTYNNFEGNNERNEVYFSKELGIVGFKDWNGILWRFDRFE